MRHQQRKRRTGASKAKYEDNEQNIVEKNIETMTFTVNENGLQRQKLKTNKNEELIREVLQIRKRASEFLLWQY